MRLSAREVAALARGTLVVGPENAVVDSVSIDSRKIEGGDLFVAIEGPRFDGHDFVDRAIAAGALGVVVHKELTTDPGVFQVRVEDTTRALQDLAHGVRARAAAPVIAITGSMGKTTTKDAAAAAIAPERTVLKTEGNLNNHYGVPLTLLRLGDEEVVVLEMGMSAAGEIERLAEIARPDVGVLTNVSGVHLEFFESVEAIADAKGELYGALGDDATAVVNADDPLVLAQARRFEGRKLRYGLGEDVDLRARNIEASALGLQFVVEEREGSATVATPLHGRHNVHNLLAGIAAARAVGVSLESAVAGLRAIEPAAHRGERIELPGGLLVIDETYNANPRAVECALDELAETAAKRRVAVLGDMMELGPEAAALHERVGRHAARRGVHLLVGVGELSRHLLDGAVSEGLEASRTLWCRDAGEAADAVSTRVREGDVLLFKASRSIGLEEAIRGLRRSRGGGES